jgi:hypothetical protein
VVVSNGKVDDLSRSSLALQLRAASGEDLLNGLGHAPIEVGDVVAMETAEVNDA